MLAFVQANLLTMGWLSCQGMVSMYMGVLVSILGSMTQEGSEPGQ